MINSNIFKDLIVLDLANNHFGDLNHAKKIIGSFSKLIKKYKIKCTVKFQFRDLDSFIHKDHLKSDNSYIKKSLGWEPSISLREGLEKTYRWIYDQMAVCVTDLG